MKGDCSGPGGGGKCRETQVSSQSENPSFPHPPLLGFWREKDHLLEGEAPGPFWGPLSFPGVWQSQAGARAVDAGGEGAGRGSGVLVLVPHSRV